MNLSPIKEFCCSKLETFVLPVGIFLALTSILFVSDRAGYALLFYAFVAIPTLVLSIFQPKKLAPLALSPLFLASAAFVFLGLVSLSWASHHDSLSSLIKRPLQIILLFFAVYFLSVRVEQFRVVLKGAAILALPVAACLLVMFFLDPVATRLSGVGILVNPLLVTHVFGFYAAYWMAGLLIDRSCSGGAVVLPILAMIILLGLLFATGSRTPLLALTGTVFWLAILKPCWRTTGAILAILVLAATIMIFAPDMILQRGVSYRPQIWSVALQKGLESIWFGHGYGTPLSIQLPDIPYPFSDPHNRTLSVFYRLGLVGVCVWISMYFVAFFQSWRWRQDRSVVVFSAMVAYGLLAGMTEGGGFLTRPNEHWFVIWIPLALLAARVALLIKGYAEVEYVGVA